MSNLTIVGALVLAVVFVYMALAQLGRWQARVYNAAHADLVEFLTSHGVQGPGEVPWGHHMDLAALLLGLRTWPTVGLRDRPSNPVPAPYDRLVLGISASSYTSFCEGLPRDAAGFARFCGALVVPTDGNLPGGFVERHSDAGRRVIASFERLCGGLVELNTRAADRMRTELATVAGGGFASDDALVLGRR